LTFDIKKGCNFKLLASGLLIAISFSFLFLSYFYNQAYFTGRHPFPTGDEPDYLTSAINLKEYGGNLKFVSFVVSSSYKDTRKHPLFLLFLSPFADKSLDFFVAGKFVNFALGCALFFISFFVIKNIFSLVSAFYYLAFLTLNEMVLKHTSIVVPDILMMILVLLSSYFYINAFKKSSLGFVFFGSFFASLAFLSKPNGILIPIVFGVYSLTAYKKKIFSQKLVWVAAITFLFFSSPILIRNLLVFKNPFYNNNVPLLFVANRQERRSPDFFKEPPTALEYIQSKGLIREIKDYIENSIKMMSNFSMLALFQQWQLRYSMAIFLLLFIAFIKDKDRVRGKYLLVTFVIFYLFFAYTYKISPHYRHELPMMFLIIGYLGLYLDKLIKILFKKKSILVVLALGLILSVYSFVVVKKEQRVFNNEAFAGQVEPLESHLFLRDWVVSNIYENDTFVKGFDDRYSFEWYVNIKGSRLIQPYFESMDLFEEYLKTESVDYLIITGPIVNSFPEIYEEYFVQAGHGNSTVIDVLGIPEVWEVVASYPDWSFLTSEYKYLIFKIRGLEN